MFKLIAGLLLAGLAAPAAAETWYKLGSSDGVAYYVDRDSLQRDGDVVSLVVFIAWQEPINAGAFARIGERHDCKNLRRRVGEMTIYAADRQVLGSDPEGEPVEWMAVPENSAAHDIWLFACDGPSGTVVDDPFADGAAWRERVGAEAR